LAISLAALLPLAQAHCMWMPLQARAAAAESSCHGCCESAPAHDAQPAGPIECPCFQLPPSTIPATSVAAPPSGPVVATFDATVAAIARTDIPAPTPASDVGSPPLPIATGAHGLRAPPLSA
jgi:hypothetical protein